MRHHFCRSIVTFSQLGYQRGQKDVGFDNSVACQCGIFSVDAWKNRNRIWKKKLFRFHFPAFNITRNAYKNVYNDFLKIFFHILHNWESVENNLFQFSSGSQYLYKFYWYVYFSSIPRIKTKTCARERSAKQVIFISSFIMFALFRHNFLWVCYG